MKHIKIGEMAKIHQISVQALQYYEKVGVFLPIYVDDETGYRYYDINQSARLDAIKLLQSLGFTLKEILQILEVDNEAFTIYQALNHRKIELKQLELEVQRQKAIVDAYMQAYNTYQNKKLTKSIEVVVLPERKVVMQKYEENIYEMSYEAYEHQLRKFRDLLNELEIPSLYFSNVGSTITEKNFIQKRYISENMFVFVGMNEESPNAFLFPAQKYAVIYCDSFSEELAGIELLQEYIQKNEYTIIGDYICEVIIEPPVLQTQKRNMFLRLQIPVK